MTNIKEKKYEKKMFKLMFLITGAVHIICSNSLSAQSSLDESAPYLEMLGSLRKDFGERPTGWEAVGAGFTEGLAYAEKRKSILEDKKRLVEIINNLERLADYLYYDFRDDDFRQGVHDSMREGFSLLREMASF